MEFALAIAFAALAALMLLVADLALGRPDGAQPDASVGERLALRARPARIALTMLVLVVLLAGGAFELAKGVRWLAVALLTSLLAAAVQELVTALKHDQVQPLRAVEEVYG